MMHPDCRLVFINEDIGHGVFATAFIPAGTITYVRDDLDIVIQPDDPRLAQEDYFRIIDTWAYREPNGEFVLGWDISRYVNHSCDANTLSTGYGFEIAIRDILPGEQITDDYGLLNIDTDMSCGCRTDKCRWNIQSDDIAFFSDRWDALLRPAIALVPGVEQPLLRYIDDSMWAEVLKYINTGRHYRSVSLLHYPGILADPDVSLS